MHHVTAQKLIVSLRRFFQVDMDVRMKVLPFRPHRHDDALSVILWVLTVPGVVEVPMTQGKPLCPFRKQGQHSLFLGLVHFIIHSGAAAAATLTNWPATSSQLAAVGHQPGRPAETTILSPAFNVISPFSTIRDRSGRVTSAR